MKTKAGLDPVALACFLLLLLLIGFFIATILLGSVPPVDRDALTHHLFVPKIWLQHGGIYEIPEIPFSYYPMNLDLLYTIPLYFGNDIVPKYIHYLFALATALLLYRHLAKRLGTPYGLLGALFFLSVPIIVKLSITVYVDLGVVFFTTAALLLLLHWAEKDFQVRFLVLSGLCCGLAAGTKYNGLIPIVALILLIPSIFQQNAPKEQQSNSKALLWGVVFAVAALASFSPWLIRNYTWTGNPIYPLHNSLIQQFHAPNQIQQVSEDKGIADTLKQISSQGGNAFIARRILYNEPWWQALLLPIRFFVEGKDDDPRYFDGKLTPFLLLLSALAFLFRPPDTRQRREQNFLFWFVLLSFFFTFFQEALRIRYVVAIVPPLVILSMYGFRGMLTRLSHSVKSTSQHKTAVSLVAAGIPLLMFWYNGQYLINQFAAVQPLPYLQGTVSRDEYITAFRPEYPAIQFLNGIIPGRCEKVLCIFLGNRGYYMNFQPVFEHPYSSSSILAQFLATENSTHTVAEELRQQKIKYILLRADLTMQWLHQLSDHDRQRIAPLFAHADQQLWDGQGFVVLTVEKSNE